MTLTASELVLRARLPNQLIARAGLRASIFTAAELQFVLFSDSNQQQQQVSNQVLGN